MVAVAEGFELEARFCFDVNVFEDKWRLDMHFFAASKYFMSTAACDF
jgi:hypothetical protein